MFLQIYGSTLRAVVLVSLGSSAFPAATCSAAEPQNASAEPESIDYTHTGVLAGVDGVERGYIVYHLWANSYGLNKIRTEHFPKVTDGRTVALDFEPWNKNQNRYPWYGDATDAENMDMLSKYASTIRELAPELKRRNLRLAVYSVPALMQRNWPKVWRQPDNTLYKTWLDDQVHMISLAEQSGFLPALRDVGGHVQVVGYVPAAWDGSRPWHATALRKSIEHMDAVLDEYNVPHRWLFKPDVGGDPMHDDLLRVCIERGGDWWSTADRPGHRALRRLMEQRQ